MSYLWLLDQWFLVVKNNTWYTGLTCTCSKLDPVPLEIKMMVVDGAY